MAETIETGLTALVQQVEILSATIQASIARNEELAKTYEQQIAELREERLLTAQEREALMVLNEGLKQSLQESDRQLTDMTRITAVLTQHDMTIKELLQEEG